MNFSTGMLKTSCNIYKNSTPVIRDQFRRSTCSSACKSGDLSYLYNDPEIIEPPPGVKNFVYNRNPRNLERLRIAFQNEGYHLEKPGNTYWHKLVVVRSSRHVSASVVHSSDFVPIKVSSNEWAIRKFLYNAGDRLAYTTVGRILARRCLESGLTEMLSIYAPEPNTKMYYLLKEVEEGGISLKEPPQMYIEHPISRQKADTLWDTPEP